MGSSVKLMQNSQIHNSNAIANPVSGIAQGMDGSHGETVISIYRDGNSTDAVSTDDVGFTVGKD